MEVMWMDDKVIVIKSWNIIKKVIKEMGLPFREPLEAPGVWGGWDPVGIITTPTGGRYVVYEFFGNSLGGGGVDIRPTPSEGDRPVLEAIKTYGLEYGIEALREEGFEIEVVE